MQKRTNHPINLTKMLLVNLLTLASMKKSKDSREVKLSAIMMIMIILIRQIGIWPVRYGRVKQRVVIEGIRIKVLIKKALRSLSIMQKDQASHQMRVTLKKSKEKPRKKPKDNISKQIVIWTHLMLSHKIKILQKIKLSQNNDQKRSMKTAKIKR